MLAYVLRRLAYGVVVVFGVLLLLFVLFFAVTDPDDIARRALGERVHQDVVEQWKHNHGYDRPLWPWQSWNDNLLFDHFGSMLSFDFGRRDSDDTLISQRLLDGIGPSLTLTLPLFVLGLLVGIPAALLVAFFRETYIDRMGVFICVLVMSVSVLLYIVGAQYLVAKRRIEGERPVVRGIRADPNCQFDGFFGERVASEIIVGEVANECSK